MKHRLRRGIWWVLGLSAVLVALFLLREVIGWFVVKQVVAALARNSGANLLIGRTSGDVYTNPKFHDVLITTDTDSFVASYITVRWQLLPLLRGRLVLSEVRIVAPSARISGIRVAQREETAARSYPSLEIRRLEIVDGRLCLGVQKGSGQYHLLRLDSLDVFLALRSQTHEMNISLLGLNGHLNFSSGNGHIEHTVIEDISGEFRVTSDSVSATHFVLQTPGSYAKGAVRFHTRKHGFGFDVDSLSISLAELSRLSVPLWKSLGRRYSAGRLIAKGACRIDSAAAHADFDYTVDTLEILEVRMPRLSGGLGLTDSLVRLQAVGSDTSLGVLKASLSLDLRNHRLLGGLAVERLAVWRFEPRLSQFRVDASVEFSGVLGSLASQRVAPIEGGATDSLSVSLKSRVAGLGIDTLAVNLIYKDGVGEIQQLKVIGNVGRLHLVGRARRDLLSVQCKFERFDLGLFGNFARSGTGYWDAGTLSGRVSGYLNAGILSDTWFLTGLLFGDSLGLASAVAIRSLVDINLTGGDGFTGRLALGVEDLYLGEFELASAQFVWAGPEFDMRIERMGVRLQAAGVLDLGRNGFHCRVERAELVCEDDTRTARRCGIRFDRDTLRVDSLRVGVADGSIGFTGWNYAGGGTAYFRVDGSHINLRKLQKLLQIPVELWGTVDFSLSGYDTLMLSLAAVDFELPAADLRLKKLCLDAALMDRNVCLRKLWFVHQVDTTRIAGDIWLTTAFDTRHSLGRLVQDVDITGLDLKIDIADPGAWVFSFLRGIVNVRSGLVYGTLHAVRARGALELSGRARVVEAVLSVPASGTTVERVNAALTFFSNTIVLDKLTGEAGTGTVLCAGTAYFGHGFMAESVCYSFKCDNVSVNPFPNVFALGSADITIRWGTERPVEFTGDIRIVDAVVGVSFGSSPSAPSASETGSLVYDLRIVADRGVWLRNREADIELGMDLQLRRTVQEQIYAGRLWSRQGNLYYLDHTLRITQGEIVFDNISRFDPDIHIVAELPVRRSRYQQMNSYPERIILALSGTLEQPSFRLESYPPVWDETQIASYLSLSVPTDELGAMGQKEAVTRMLSERLLNYFQTQVTKRLRDFVALDYLELESGLVTGGGARVTVGKYVGRNLYLSYTQSIASEMQPAFSLEYYIDQRNELLAERSADGSYSVLWRLKLKY
ncbi:MAG: translocation/assembly module TamB domain-containing protein [candidate division WOR-3 bacterium]